MSGDLRPRLISGLIAFAVVLPILVLGGFWGVLALAAVAAAWGLHEIVTMAMPAQRATAWPMALVLGSGWFAVAAFSTRGGVPGWEEALPGVGPLLPVVVLSVVLSAIYFLLTAKTTDGLGDRWAHFVLGLAYVAVPLGLFASLRGLEAGRAWLFAPLFAGWCGDIGGYFAGRAFGRHKMIPLISPKKTWEGFVGGIGLAVVGVVLLKVAFVDPFVDGPSPLTVLDCAVVGVLADVTGVAGDLVASMLKRNHGVKDSGRFLPGHGGMLDRIDAVMFAVPVVWLWAVVVRPLVVG